MGIIINECFFHANFDFEAIGKRPHLNALFSDAAKANT